MTDDVFGQPREVALESARTSLAEVMAQLDLTDADREAYADQIRDVQEMMQRLETGVLHLATFGILNKANPLFSFVELGDSPEGPGFLEAHEIYGLGLDARLVTLSACETALGSGGLWNVPPGDDWINLATAFLEAGVGTVQASLWQVEDLATAELMQEFYRHLTAGSTMEGALVEAQRSLLSNPDTAHPFFWAGFMIVGAGGEL